MKRRTLALLLTSVAALLSACGQSPSPAPVSETAEASEQTPLPESVSEPDPLPEPENTPEPAAEDFAPVAEKASHITPVPGGVGPMTRVMLLENTLTAALGHGKG